MRDSASLTPPIDILLDFPSQLYYDSIHDVLESLSSSADCDTRTLRWSLQCRCSYLLETGFFGPSSNAAEIYNPSDGRSFRGN
ncbi:unnamed protein product [Cylicocyclus nassatus]|uniref:Uncharacterized protein n=1 Tax=Cylicocyclus nassatus TaxID=53992 RepID=A0AA36GUR0_CYLNA|nr:unnamed protein product [Cylicocyclus nassatus]